MKALRTFASICALLLLNSQCQPLVAQDVTASDSIESPAVRGIQFARPSAQKAEDPLLAGMSVGFDVCGAVMSALTSWGQLEGSFRLNLYNTYFPTVEAGLGISDNTGEETHLHFSTRSPYFRLGCDYNFVKDHASANRLFAGLRYAFSPFRYDVEGPDLTDPVYGATVPFSYKGLSATSHWLELVAGVDARVWRFVHLGWTVRYKVRVSESSTTVGRSWYVPGYGRSGGHALGGTFNVIIDI